MLRFSRALRVGGHSITADAVALHSSKSAFSRLPSSSSIMLLLPGASCSYATSTTIPPNHIFKPYPTLKDSSGKLLARVSGRTDVPLSELSLSQFWDKLVQKHADRPALICRHEPPHLHQVGPSSPSPIADDSSCLRWSYADMDAHITSVARGLQNLGVGPGSVVAVLMMNNSAYGALQWATAKLGAILVTLNPSYSTRELGQALNQVKASTLVLVPGLRSSDYLAALNGLMPSLASNGKGGEVDDENFPMLKRLVLVDNLTQRPKRWEGTSVHTKDGLTFAQALEKLNGKALDYRDVLAEGQAAAKQGGNALPQVDPQQVINLQLTSGTTGRPKAVALTSRNLLNNVGFCAQFEVGAIALTLAFFFTGNGHWAEPQDHSE
jgi:acyl-CoA synthetase (AMP-forming)/AMP-acid ligase II